MFERSIGGCHAWQSFLRLGQRAAPAVAFTLTLGWSLLRCGGDASLVGVAQTEARLEGMAGTAGVSGGASSFSRADVAGSSAMPSALPSSTDLWIVELKIDPPGTDGAHEFAELRGTPSSQLSGYWVVALEGDADANPGQVDVALDLSKCPTAPCQLDPNGLLLLLGDATATVPPPGSAWYSPKELANGRLENGSTTLLIVQGLLGPPNGSDWDVDDDGMLELHGDVIVRDAVAWSDGTVGDRSYATHVLGPKPKAQATWQCPWALGTTSGWRWGELLGDSASLTINTARATPEGLDATELTPGSPNHCDLPPEANGVQATNTPPGNAGGAGTANSGACDSETLSDLDCRASGSNTPPAALGFGGHSSLGNSASTGATEAPGRTTVATQASASGIGNAPQADPLGRLGGYAGSPTTIRVVTASPQAGTTSWWSTNPYAQALGNSGYTHTRASATTRTNSGTVAGDTNNTPPMPGTCAVSRGRSTDQQVWLLTALLSTLARRARRRCGQWTRSRKIALRPSASRSGPCVKPAIPLYARPQNVEPSDLERAPTS